MRHSLVKWCLIAATCWAATVAPSFANKRNDTLIFASNLEPENISPYHNNTQEGVVIARMVWDNLIYRNPKTGEFQPQLATSWKWTDDTTLDLKLRSGVQFHNGDPLTIKDVVFTLNYVVSPESKTVSKQNVEWIKSAEALDADTVRIHLHKPFPAALDYLSGPIPIFPENYFKKVGLQGFAKAPVGSGPYRITQVQLGKGVSMERFPGYWKGSPLGNPSITKVEYRVVPDAEARVAQLLTGEVDWIWRVPAEQSDSLASRPGIAVQGAETMRIAFLQFNPYIKDSPLQDVRVRQAINYAINREALTKYVLKGGSQLSHAPCFRQQTGCVETAAVQYPFDPAKAKQLLAEAGFEKGFPLSLHIYRDRDVAESILNDLRKVGIQAKLVNQQYAAMRDDYRAGKAPIIFLTWGSFAVNDASASIGNFFAGGADDGAKDAEVQNWIKTANTSMDLNVRKENYGKAIRKVSEQAYMVPLVTYSIFYAYDKDLEFTAYPDELPRFYESRWK